MVCFQTVARIEDLSRGVEIFLASLGSRVCWVYKTKAPGNGARVDRPDSGRRGISLRMPVPVGCVPRRLGRIHEARKLYAL
jgi:hypothetical protein